MNQRRTEGRLRTALAEMSGWAAACILVVTIKIAAALFTFGYAFARSGLNRSSLLFSLFVLSFGVTGGLLVLHRRQDQRAANLGCVFLLISASFADGLLKSVRVVSPLGRPATDFIYAIHIFSFLPCFLWLFVRDFPRSLTTASIAFTLRVGFRASLYTACALFALNILNGGLTVATGTPEPLGVLSIFSYPGGRNYYWSLVYLFMIPAFVMGLWKLRLSPVTERRRLSLLILGMVLGIGPLVFLALLEFLVHPVGVYLQANRNLENILVYPLLLSLPFTSSYAVIVHRALDIKLIVRKALQYGLARYSVAGLASVPFVYLAIYVFQNRSQSVEAFFEGRQIWLLLLIASCGFVLLRVRNRILNSIDRRFFREQYLSHKHLTKLVESIFLISDVEELVRLVIHEIDRALHLENAAVLVFDPRTASFVAPDNRCRALHQSSKLAELLEVSSDPLNVDFDQQQFQEMPPEDQQWLADGGFHLLAPMVSSDGHLSGIIALGAKKSELPFSNDDASLIRTVAASSTVVLENRNARDLQIRSAAVFRGGEEELAQVCTKCGQVESDSRSTCQRCGSATSEALIPVVLWGKFKLEAQVGAGGMGIVYSGTDLSLRRRIAIKTLPRISPWHSMLLRREARAMAAVVHPNLATIYGVESWKGLPMLLVEFMENGTLADRLRCSKLDVAETLELGIRLSKVLELIHAAGILHRDIKPSNIGYTRDWTPKLMDFGLAQMLTQSVRTTRSTNTRIRDQFASSSHESRTLEDDATYQVLFGTPIYMAPEALKRSEPSPDFDLWSLNVVLFEVLAGRPPFSGSTLAELVDQTRRGPELQKLLQGRPASLLEYFRRVFAKNPESRPRSALQLRQILEELSAICGTSNLLPGDLRAGVEPTRSVQLKK